MIKKEFSSLLKSKGLKATMATVLLVPVLYSVNVNIKMYKSDKIKMYNYSKLT